MSRRSLMRGLGVGVASAAVLVGADARSAGAATASAQGLLPDPGSGVGSLTGTLTSLLTSNPVLEPGQQAYSSDTNQLFIGDGQRRLNELVPFEAPSGVELGSATDGEARSFSNVSKDYPNLAIGPFTVPAGKLAYVHLFLPNCYLTADTTSGAFAIVHGAGSTAPAGTPMDDAGCLLVGNGLLYTTVDRSAVARLGPGTYTAKVLAYDSADPGTTEANFQGFGKARLWAVLA